MERAWDVIVIGAGAAGLTAAKETASAGLRTACVESLIFGGLILNINELNPALDGANASGADLASDMLNSAMDAGVESLSGTVDSIESDGDGFAVRVDGEVHTAGAVIVASGARLKRLGIPGEEEYEGRGVSQCADCDGPFFAEKDVIVVGGGDSALQEAITLARLCAMVHIVHRDDAFTASPEFVAELKGFSNVNILWNTVVERLEGEEHVEKAVLWETKAGRNRELPCSAMFAYVGLEPSSGFLGDDVPRDEHGYVVTDASLETRVRGLFAAGVVRKGCGGLLSDAVDDGRVAAGSAIRLLQSS